MHIFISYAKKDTKPLAEKLAATFNGMPFWANGVLIWLFWWGGWRIF